MGGGHHGELLASDWTPSYLAHAVPHRRAAALPLRDRRVQPPDPRRRDGLQGDRASGVARQSGARSLRALSEVASRLQAFAGESFLHFNRDNEASRRSSRKSYRRTDSTRAASILVVDPLLGAANLDINAPLGSVFSVLRAPSPGRETKDEDFQKGKEPGRRGLRVLWPLHHAGALGRHGRPRLHARSHVRRLHAGASGLEVPPETRELSINSTNSPSGGAGEALRR